MPATVLGAKVVGRAPGTAVECRCPGAAARVPAVRCPPRRCPAGRGDPRPPVPRRRHRAVGRLRSSGPGASHRALGRPLRSLLNQAPGLIGTGRPVFIKRALAGGGSRDGPDLRMLD